jgi:hypothetical protein
MRRRHVALLAMLAFALATPAGAHADVDRGNESFFVRDRDDRRMLELPAGAMALSPVTCVGIERPTVRFFVKRTSGWVLSHVRVEVLYNGLDGQLRTLALAPVFASGSWQPTLPLPIAANLLPNLSGDQAVVAFRFTAVGGSFKVDDVYVDPYAKR